MLPGFGTPLRRLMFEPNDAVVQQQAKDMIVESIRRWEPRITIDEITITTGFDDLNPEDTLYENKHILGIKIRFFDPETIQEVQELVLEVPLAGIGGA